MGFSGAREQHGKTIFSSVTPGYEGLFLAVERRMSDFVVLQLGKIGYDDLTS